MVLFNYSTKELTAKIVYYGPGLCGKTTNLEFIYESLPEEKRGRMLSLSTQTDRTLYFDFLPVELGDIRGMTTRVQLYTVPGQVFYDETRRMVLKGVDGVVFVADSQAAMADANLESFQNLQDNLTGHGLDLAEMPMVLQFNKRDLPGIQQVEEMNAALNRFNAPFYEAIATTGIGVHDTLKAISKLVLRSLTQRYEGGHEQHEAASNPVTEAAPARAPDALALGGNHDTTPEIPPAVESAPPAVESEDWECSDLENELDQMDATEIQGLLEEVDCFDGESDSPPVEDSVFMGEAQASPAASAPEPSAQNATTPEAESDSLFATPAAIPGGGEPTDEDGSVWMGGPEGEETVLIPGESADLEAALAVEAEDGGQELVAPQEDEADPLPVLEDVTEAPVPEPALDPSLTFENFMGQAPAADDAQGARALPVDGEADVAVPVMEASDGPALVPGEPERDGNGDLRVPLHLQVDGQEHTYILTLSLQALPRDPS